MIDEREFFGFGDQGQTKPLGEPVSDKDDLAGHRERLRERFRKTGPDSLADYEILEILLYRTIPRADTKPIAKALLKKFNGLSGVFGAPEVLLQEVPGVGASVALDLKILFAASQRMLKSEISGRELLSSWDKVLAYCNAAMAHENREQFRILFLDKKNVLIADEVQQKGTVDHTPVYPREVIKRALELAATAIILVHNHPTWPFRSRSITPHHLETQRLLGLS